MRSIWLSAATLLVSLSVATVHGSPANDQAAELLIAARAALGGPKLDAVTAIKATGEYRRMMGEREIDGDVTIELAVPDRLKRTEEMGFPGGPTFTRVMAVNGQDFWEDTTNRGGGGGRFMMRMGGDGQAQAPSDADRERFRQMQQRRLTSELHRLMLIWLMRTDAPVTYVGTAEASDGKADVLDVKIDEQQPPLRLYLDSQTHVPLMVSYTGVMPRFNFRRAGRPDRPGARPEAAPGSATDAPPSSAPPAPSTGTAQGEGVQGGGDQASGEPRRREPQQVTFEVRLADYKKVDGVLLPHLMTQSVNGKPTEELTIAGYKINPKFDQDAFVKKSR
jgi:hypothetical protein